MSKEEVLSIIKEYPEAIIEALERKPELLTSLILKLAPWDRFATKEDIRMILEFMEKRFDDINKRFEELMSYSDKRFEDINKRFESVDKRFEDINKRFESIDKRFEDINKRFEDINRRFEELRSYSDKRFESIEKRFEDINKRFEDMKYYVDRRFDEVNRRLTTVERIMIAFNIPILIAILTMLIKAFI